VIGTDCIGSYISNYHLITTTTTPLTLWVWIPFRRDVLGWRQRQIQSGNDCCLISGLPICYISRGKNTKCNLYNWLKNDIPEMIVLSCGNLTLWVWIPFRRDVLDATFCDKVCLWLVAGQWFSLDIIIISSKQNFVLATEFLTKIW
jgi:hypothetical protein